MNIEITVPAWTESEAEEGFIANWFASDGATVRAGEVLGELMVEKATIEISAPQDGTIQNIRLQRGDVVKPGMVIAELAPTGEAVAATTTPSASSASGTATAPAEADFVPASPVARRLARELGVDLTRVTPARGQRITEDDVRRVAATVSGPVGTMSPPAAATPPRGSPCSLRRRRPQVAACSQGRSSSSSRSSSRSSISS